MPSHKRAFPKCWRKAGKTLWAKRCSFFQSKENVRDLSGDRASKHKSQHTPMNNATVTKKKVISMENTPILKAREK